MLSWAHNVDDEKGSHMADGVFRRSAMNRVASAEELDRYIKVANPSAWVIVLSALLLVGGIIVWAVVAIVPVTAETTGVALQDQTANKTIVACWVDKTTAKRIEQSGLVASIDGVEAKSASMNKTPMSASEVVRALGSDFYADSIKLDDWNYLIWIEPGEEPKHSDFTIETVRGEAHLVPVSILVFETQPINIVLGKK